MKKFLSLALALIMVMSLFTVGASAAFADADEIQYTEAVEVMSGLGILKGSNGSFDPKGNITRQAAAKVIAYIALGVEDAEKLTCIESPFADVAATATLAPYVAWAAKEGIINGVGDGTNFEPKSFVSGHAFLKMVLGALGIEGTYTGDGWRLNVTTAAAEAELFEGIDTNAIDLRANITRELASQIAFNAMFYSADESETMYAVYTEVFEDDELVNVIWHYEGSDAQAAAFAKIANEGSTMEQYSVSAGSFAWENFGLLSNKAYGEFNRPATLYTSVMDEDLEVYVYDTPVLTYENGATDKKIWGDLGYTKASETAKLYVTTDGIDVAELETYSKGEDADTVGGKGAIVEVYKTETSKTFDVVVINTYVQKLGEDFIKKAVPATDTEDAIPAYIIIGEDKTLAYDEDGTFETDAFAKNDVVLYTKDGAEIKTVVKAEKVENVKVTKYTSSAFTVGEKTYNFSAKLAADSKTPSFTQAYNLFLDAQGNIIYRENYSSAPAAVIKDYAYITKIAVDAGASASLLDGAVEPVAVAEVIFVDGTKEVVEIQVKKATAAIAAKDGNAAVAKNEYYASIPTSDGKALRVVISADVAETAVANWFAFKANEDGTYTFSKINEDYAKVSATNVTADKGVAEKINADKRTTSATVYTYIDTEGTVTTATGLVKMTMAAASNKVLYTYAKDATTVTAVFAVEQAELGEETPDAVYAYAVKGGAYVKDGREWKFYIDGEEVTYVVDDEVTVAQKTIYAVTIDEDGIVTAAEAVATTGTEVGTIKVMADRKIDLVDDAYFAYGSVVVYFTEDSAVYNIEDGIAAGTIEEETTATVVIEKNDDGQWELIAAYITKSAE